MGIFDKLRKKTKPIPIDAHVPVNSKQIQKELAILRKTNPEAYQKVIDYIKKGHKTIPTIYLYKKRK
jgi:hypothetical protein